MWDLPGSTALKMQTHCELTHRFLASTDASLNSTMQTITYQEDAEEPELIYDVLRWHGNLSSDLTNKNMKAFRLSLKRACYQCTWCYEGVLMHNLYKFWKHY